MAFSSLTDSVDVARAHAALDRAWGIIKAGGYQLLGSDQVERQRLAVIVAGLVYFAEDDEDLIERAVKRFLETGCATKPSV